jgi:hypothetical protein
VSRRRAYVAVRRQTPIAGGRRQLPACVLKEIRERVELEADREGVSRSWVVAVRLAASYGIKGQEQY